MNKALVRAALVTSTLAAVLLPVSPVSAATLAVEDAQGDVWRTTYDFSTDEETGPEPAGSPVNVDLTRTVVKHTARKVVLKARYADLRKGTDRFSFMAQVRTNEGLKRQIEVETFTRQGWGGNAFFGGSKGELRCKGLTHDIDYAGDTLTVAVPRACLSKPRWVQVRAMTASFVESDPETMVMHQDNWSNESPDVPPSWSGKVRRG